MSSPAVASNPSASHSLTFSSEEQNEVARQVDQLLRGASFFVAMARLEGFMSQHHRGPEVVGEEALRHLLLSNSRPTHNAHLESALFIRRLHRVSSFQFLFRTVIRTTPEYQERIPGMAVTTITNLITSFEEWPPSPVTQRKLSSEEPETLIQQELSRVERGIVREVDTYFEDPLNQDELETLPQSYHCSLRVFLHIRGLGLRSVVFITSANAMMSDINQSMRETRLDIARLQKEIGRLSTLLQDQSEQKKLEEQANELEGQLKQLRNHAQTLLQEEIASSAKLKTLEHQCDATEARANRCLKNASRIKLEAKYVRSRAHVAVRYANQGENANNKIALGGGGIVAIGTCAGFGKLTFSSGGWIPLAIGLVALLKGLYDQHSTKQEKAKALLRALASYSSDELQNLVNLELITETQKIQIQKIQEDTV